MKDTHESPSDTGLFRSPDGNPIRIDDASGQATSRIIGISQASIGSILSAIREEELYGKNPTVDLIDSRMYDPSDKTVFTAGGTTLKEFLKTNLGSSVRVIKKGSTYFVTSETYRQLTDLIKKNPKSIFLN